MKEYLSKINKIYFGLWSLFYDYDPISLWLKSIQAEILNKISIPDKSSVLDVGCGSGNALKILYANNVKKLYGIDLSGLMIKKAKKKLSYNAVLKTAGVENIPFKDNFFDYVFSFESFHHFSDPDIAIKEMRRVLKKNGKLIIADIDFYFFSKLFEKLEPGCVKIYNKNDFKDLFSKNKLKLISQDKVGSFVNLNIGKKIKN